MIPVTDTVRVQRQVRKATEAACRSTYKPLGGRPYEEVYLNSLAPATDWASYRAAKHNKELREFDSFCDAIPVIGHGTTREMRF